MLPHRPIKKVVPARSKEAAKRSQALAADLFGSDSSNDDDESIQDLCSTSSNSSDDTANGNPLVEESTDLSSESEDEEPLFRPPCSISASGPRWNMAE